MSRSAQLPERQTVSAGGVVYRRGAQGVEVLLLETPGGVWGLPKGTPDYGETLLQTAQREVREETGLEIASEDKIGAIDYWFVSPERRERFHKFVHFWLMRPVGGDLDHHDEEHVSVRWFPLRVALRRVTHKNSAQILECAADLLAARDAAGAEARLTTRATRLRDGP